MASLEYPQLREQLFSVVKGLTEEGLQQRFWLGGDPDRPPTFPSSFEWVREALYDYQDFRQPNACVGELLYDERERQAIVELLDRIDDIGIEGYEPDEKFLNHPAWPKVVEAARKAHAVFKEGDEKYSTG